MKYTLTLFFALLSWSISSQIIGNKKIVTKSFDLEKFEQLEVSLYANIEVDMQSPSMLTITIDENLLPFVGRSVYSGRLELDQKEWISPSQEVVIKIGAPALKFFQQGTHDATYIKNIDKAEFSAMANVGKIILEGEVQLLNANAEVGEIDARNLVAKEVDLNIWSWGQAQLDNPSLITGKVKENGTAFYSGANTSVKVKTRSGGRVVNRATEVARNEDATRYIEIKLKNNSFKRINAYVRGPKPDGKYFSYGFPMNPGQIKKERWTIGTKVFRRTNIGLKKLLVEITEGDEGGVVKLYE